MGVFLNLSIVPERIAPEEWHSVYYETLTLVEQFPFLDKVQRGDGLWFAQRTAHREDLFDGKCGGWRTFGDMVHGSNTESFYLADDINYYTTREPDNGADLLFNSLDGADAKGPSAYLVWANKTQGMDSHVYLLAIACLICHRLPGAAMVDGDISAGQCRRAVAWANQYLTDPIDMPATADMTRLLPRLREAGVPEHQLLEAFFDTSLEPKDSKMGIYLCGQLGTAFLENYYRERLNIKANKDGEYQINRTVLKEYLQLGLDFHTICRIVLSGENGQRITPEAFLKMLLEMKLHVQDKETFDFTQTCRDKADVEYADSVWSQLFQIIMIMSGGRNRNVNAYIPLESICKEIQSIVGVNYDIKAMAEQILADGIEAPKDSAQAKFYDDPNSKVRKVLDKRIEDVETYDILGFEDLAEYNRGDTLKPDLEKNIVGVLRAMAEFADEELKTFRLLDRGDREKWFANHNTILITEEIQKRILDCVMDERLIRRYLAIYCTEINSDKIGYLIHALLWNPDLLDCYWTLMESSDSESESYA